MLHVPPDVKNGCDARGQRVAVHTVGVIEKDFPVADDQ